MDKVDAKGIEAAAIAIDALWSEGQDRGPEFSRTEREYQEHCRSTARAAIAAYLAALPASGGEAAEVRSHALAQLRWHDERTQRVHDIVEELREIVLAMPVAERPDGLMKKAQDAVYGMRGRVRLLDDAAITAALSPVQEEVLVRERDEVRKVLRDHHKWHAESGVLGIPDGDGGWIEMDNSAEYADSRLCQRTGEALRDMPAEFVVPPRGGWTMGSNHWENWQLAYRQKRAAEAERDSWRRVSERLEGEKVAAEANAARMREALEPFAVEANGWADMWHDDYIPVLTPATDDEGYNEKAAFTVGDLRRARAALEAKDE